MTMNQTTTETGDLRLRPPAVTPPSERKLLQAPTLPACPPWLRSLPADFVVTIDGPARTGKNTAGALVAEAIGGVLVDSGRFYRALTKAALVSGVNLDWPLAVTDFCAQVDLQAQSGFDGSLVEEALAVVQGICFPRATLEPIAAQTAKLAQVPAARELVNGALRSFAGRRRLVVLGRDMGARVFPEAPLKVFLTAPLAVLEQRQVNTTGQPGAKRRVAVDRPNTFRVATALEIDTSRHQPAAVRDLILTVIQRGQAKLAPPLLPPA